MPVIALEIGAALALVLVQSVSGVKTGQETLGRIEHKPDTPDRSGGGQPGKRRLGNAVDLLKARGGRIEGDREQLPSRWAYRSRGLTKCYMSWQRGRGAAGHITVRDDGCTRRGVRLYG